MQVDCFVSGFSNQNTNKTAVEMGVSSEEK